MVSRSSCRNEKVKTRRQASLRRIVTLGSSFGPRGPGVCGGTENSLPFAVLLEQVLD